MNLTGLHLLLTYKCIFECDHCFVWGGPGQEGTMPLSTVDLALAQAKEIDGLRRIYFEGGEPFLFYPVLAAGVERAAGMGFEVGIVSNAYWATDREDALRWLRPFAGRVGDLSISGDLYHGDEIVDGNVANAVAASEELGIPAAVITIAQPGEEAPPGTYCVRYRGRAASELAGRAEPKPAVSFTSCEHEELRDPGRLHLDPLGNLHVCQGISIGNIFEKSLRDVSAGYDPESHPVVAPLLEGGPAELARRYGLQPAESYADCCHMCDEARQALRERFPELLAPDQMYRNPD
jgi:MoaA/NifB/PqqE/SkfB family radical SAM enzyme